MMEQADRKEKRKDRIKFQELKKKQNKKTQS